MGHQTKVLSLEFSLTPPSEDPTGPYVKERAAELSRQRLLQSLSNFEEGEHSADTLDEGPLSSEPAHEALEAPEGSTPSATERTPDVPVEIPIAETARCSTGVQTEVNLMMPDRCAEPNNATPWPRRLALRFG